MGEHLVSGNPLQLGTRCSSMGEHLVTGNPLQLGWRCSSMGEHLIMVRWVLDQSLIVDPLSYFLFQPVI